MSSVFSDFLTTPFPMSPLFCYYSFSFTTICIKIFGFSSDQNQGNVMHDNISTKFVKVDCTSHWNCIIQYIYRGPVLYTVALYTYTLIWECLSLFLLKISKKAGRQKLKVVIFFRLTLNDSVFI